MIKICDKSLIKPLTIVFNNCINTRIFPDNWRKSNVSPIYKKNDKKLLNIYRPVFLLLIFSKIFERLIISDILNILIHIIYLNQTNQVLDLMTCVFVSYYWRLHTTYFHHQIPAPLWKLEQYFDKVWHERLIFKLKSVRIAGNLLKLRNVF